MKTFIAILLLIIGLLVGGMIGYSLGVVNMQEEAIAEGHAIWSKIESDGENYGVRDNGKWEAYRLHSFEFKWN